MATTQINMDATLDVPVATGFPTVYSMTMKAIMHKTFDPQSITSTPIDSVTLVSGPSIGRVVVQDNLTVVVNLDDTTADAGSTAFTIEVDQASVLTQCVVDVTIEVAPQNLGWGMGSVNFLPVDPVTGRWDRLKGEGHKTWYIDGENGLTVGDIATAENIGSAAVTGQFLMDNHPTYGGSEATAIAVDAARELQDAIPDRNNMHFLFKAGSDLSTAGGDDIIMEKFGKDGIDGTYPALIGSYGTGNQPIYIGQNRTGIKGGYLHFEDIEIAPLQKFRFVGFGPGLVFNMVTGGGVETGVTDSQDFTAFNCKFLDSTGLEPSAPNTDWSSVKSSRASGLYTSNCDGHAVWYSMFDQCGYDAATYRQDGLWNNGQYGLPPSKYSHGVYCNKTSNNISYVGNIATRNASQGLQIRPGGMVLWNLCVANPVAMQIIGTNRPGGVNGFSNYTLASGNVTIQGFKHDPSMHEADGGIYDSNDVGAWMWANGYQSRGICIMGDMVLHPNDPNDPLDIEVPRDSAGRKNTAPIENGGTGPVAEGSFWMFYGWDEEPAFPSSMEDQSDFVNEQYLEDNVTIQLYADEVLSTAPGTSTAVDLIEHYRGLSDLRSVAKAASDWFSDQLLAAGDLRYGAVPTRTVAQTVKAVLNPNGTTSGKWWIFGGDWDTGDYPGTVAGDNADLQGHRFFTQIPQEITLGDLTVGDGGGMWVTGSSVIVGGDVIVTNEGHIGTVGAGRLTFDGYSGSDDLFITTTGGIVINDGTIAGNTDFSIKPKEYVNDANRREFMNDGHMLLCTTGNSVTVGAGHRLEVHGYADAAFDGPTGTGTLSLNGASTLSFVARGTFHDSHENNPYKFGVIRNKQTGHFGDVAPQIMSVVNLNNTLVEIDATGMAAGTYTVMDVDTLNGSLGAITVTGGNASIAIVANELQITVTV